MKAQVAMVIAVPWSACTPYCDIPVRTPWVLDSGSAPSLGSAAVAAEALIWEDPELCPSEALPVPQAGEGTRTPLSADVINTSQAG